jgi:hypothetical protein
MKMLKPLPSLVLLCFALGLSIVAPASSRAQGAAKDLVGMWTPVSVTVDQGGTKTNPYGPNPKGILTFDSSGHFSAIFVSAELPKFAANSRTAGTPEENKAVVQGSLAYCGTYTAGDSDKSLVYRIEASTFPNWMGVEQKRTFALSGDQLTITNPAPSGGGGSATLVYKRAK